MDIKQKGVRIGLDIDLSIQGDLDVDTLLKIEGE